MTEVSSRWVIIRHTAFLTALIWFFAGLCCCQAKTISIAAEVKTREMTKEAQVIYYYLLSQEQLRQGLEEEAAQSILKLLQLTPSLDLYLEYASLLWNQGKIDETREILNKILKEHPDTDKIHYYLAYTYIQQKDLPGAAAVLENYIKIKPGDPDGMRELAAIYIELNEYQKALDLVNSILKTQKSSPLFYYKAKALTGLDRRRQAIDVLNRALKEDPLFEAGWAELGYLYELESEPALAEKAYRRIIDLGKESREVWLRIVRLNLRMGREDNVINILQNAPKDRNFTLDVIALCLDEGHPELANRFLVSLAEEKDLSEDPDILFYKAILANEQEKDPQKSYAMLAKLPKNYHDYEKSLIFRIRIAIDMDDEEKALQSAREGQEIYPDKPLFFVVESEVLEKYDNRAQAMEVISKAVQKWPDNTDLLYQQGVFWEKEGKRDEALANMEKILTFDKKNSDAKNFIGYTLAEEGRDLERALDLITQALEVQPENAAYLDSLAWVYYKMGKYSLAWTEIKKAAAKQSKDATIWEHYGDIAQKIGDLKQAAFGYRKCLEFSPENQEDVKKKLEDL